MNQPTAHITEKNVAIICPTKNQSDKILRLLHSVDQLFVPPAQIIIADSSDNFKQISLEAFPKLNLKHLKCETQGQILQRNFARNFLDDEIDLVLHIDDDNTFVPNSLNCLLQTWNLEVSRPKVKQLAGMSFNVLDIPIENTSWARRFAFLGTRVSGAVSIAGYASPYVPAKQTQEVSWLLGGSTAWSREILDKHPHPIQYATKWAVCEDLMFSYPLKQNYRLIVAKDAVAFHNSDYSDMSFQNAMFFGLSSSIMRYNFVCQNRELRFYAYVWMTLGIIVGSLFKGVCGRHLYFGIFFGNIEGLSRALLCSAFGQDYEKLARMLANR